MSAVLVAALMLLAEDPAASAPEPAVPTIGAPHWLRRPSGDDVARVYPGRARARGLGGRVVMSCTIKADGHMNVCTLLSESPGDLGLGKAALRLAPYFVMSKQTDDGRPVEGGTVMIPIIFQLPR